LDPEYELAIKISEYFEFLWDGRVPVWSLDHSHVTVTFAALLPLELNRREPESASSLVLSPNEENSFRDAVRLGNQDVVAGKIHEFLFPRAYRKPRLRRAAKTAGLWMRTKRDSGEQFAERYVAPLDDESDRFLSAGREFKPGNALKEEEVLNGIAAQSSALIAADLIALATFCAHHPLANLYQNVSQSSDEEGGDQSPSVASLQYDLTCHFFRFPEHMSQVAEALRYVPSFAARVADAVLMAAPRESLGWFSRALDSHLYFLAAAFVRRRERQPMAVKIGAGIRRKGVTSAAGLVEAAIAEIDPSALKSFTRPARIAKLDANGTDPAFAVSMYLLAAKPWCVKIADAFDIPVPFGVLLGEELDHIDQSRAKWVEPGALLPGAGVLPYA
jgi:hypothetical protein